MKKLIVPFKEENIYIREISEEEMKKVQSGGCFACFFWKWCVGFKNMAKCPTNMYA